MCDGCKLGTCGNEDEGERMGLNSGFEVKINQEQEDTEAYLAFVVSEPFPIAASCHSPPQSLGAAAQPVLSFDLDGGQVRVGQRSTGAKLGINISRLSVLL